jgi:transposase
VHARSVVTAAIDGQTGEIVRAQLRTAHPEAVGWVRELQGAVRGSL